MPNPYGEFFEDDPTKSVESLLAEIKKGAMEGSGNGKSRLVLAITPFATLLIKLSRDADRTARTVRRLTWAIFGLTFILVVLTVVLTGFTWVLLTQEAAQKAEYAHAQQEAKALQGENEPDLYGALLAE
jgi:type II secretory pathway component PulL